MGGAMGTPPCCYPHIIILNSVPHKVESNSITQYVLSSPLWHILPGESSKELTYRSACPLPERCDMLLSEMNFTQKKGKRKKHFPK